MCGVSVCVSMSVSVCVFVSGVCVCVSVSVCVCVSAYERVCARVYFIVFVRVRTGHKICSPSNVAQRGVVPFAAAATAKRNGLC